MDDIKKTDELNDSQLESANGGVRRNSPGNIHICLDCGVVMQFIGGTRNMGLYKCPKCKRTFYRPR